MVTGRVYPETGEWGVGSFRRKVTASREPAGTGEWEAGVPEEAESMQGWMSGGRVLRRVKAGRRKLKCPWA